MHAGKVKCGKKMHPFTIHNDGSYTCECADAQAKAQAAFGAAMLGAGDVALLDGCAGMALVMEARGPLAERAMRKYAEWSKSQWHKLYHRYGQSVLWHVALGLGKKAADESRREQIAAFDAIRKKVKGLPAGRSTVHLCWDVEPAELNGWMVSMFAGDHWYIPLLGNWYDEVAKKGVAVKNGTLVIGKAGGALLGVRRMDARLAHSDGAWHITEV